MNSHTNDITAQFLARGPWLITDEGALAWCTRRADSTAATNGKNIFGFSAEPSLTINGKTAIVEAVGTLMKSPSALEKMLGAVSYEDIQTVLARATLADGVDKVIFKLTSPGGSFNGSDECARAIAGLNRIAPIIGFVDELGASAAFYLLAGCNKLFVAPTAQVGNVGVLLQISTFQKQLEALGIDINVFSSDPAKQFGHPSKAMSEDAKNYFQSRVDIAAQMFKDFVTAQRPGLKRDVLDGRLFFGKQAVAVGLADGVADSIFDVVGTSTRAPGTRTGVKGQVSPDPILAEWHAHAELRAEFITLENLKAFRQAEGQGRVHIAARSTEPNRFTL